MRRRVDQVEGYRRGAEPVSHGVWDGRVRRLLRRFRDGGRFHIDDLVAWSQQTYGWGENLAKNVVAAAEDRGRIRHDADLGAWIVREDQES